MKNERFISLRKQYFSQEQLAEKMGVSIQTLRKWENQKSLPTIEQMKELSIFFHIDEQYIFEMFQPENIKTKTEEVKMYEVLKKLFWGCQNAEQFIMFSSLFSSKETIGSIYGPNAIFLFTKIASDGENGTTAVFSDKWKNHVVLTKYNIFQIIPLSIEYDTFTFEVMVNCPIFPINTKEKLDDFKQKIKISFLVNGGH